MDRKDKQQEILELRTQRKRYLQEYKMGLIRAEEMVTLVREIDFRIIELERENLYSTEEMQ